MALKADKQIDLRVIPYFWTRNSLLVSELDGETHYVGLET